MLKQTIFALLILGNFVSLWAGDMFPKGEMADGSFIPGTVLLYDHGQWLTTENENAVNPEEYTFVIIHGAHNSLKTAKISRLAKTLKEKKPKANILAVDWNVWSSVDSSEFVNWTGIIFRQISGENDEDFSLTNICLEIVQKAIPVEQARFIPRVADRLTWKLFGEAGKTRTFSTFDPKTKKKIGSKMTALGLDPEKTHLIGHSHGAHVAGLTGLSVQKKGLGRLDWISALDPSTSLVHDYPENPQGTGWDASAARLVAVFRTTYFFSSERKATNDFLFFDWRNPNHSINHTKAKLKNIGWIYEVVQSEFKDHAQVFNRFMLLIQETGYLDEVFDPNRG